MTLSFLLLVVAGGIFAPFFTVVLAGLLVHHGIWSLQWAVPTLWVCFLLRYHFVGGRLPRRSFRAMGWGLVVTLSLLFLGLYWAHLCHHLLSPGSRLVLSVVLFVLALSWLGRADRILPERAARVWTRLPRPQRFPRGTRRVAAALVVIPFWAPRPVTLTEALDERAGQSGLDVVVSSIQEGNSVEPGLRAILGAQRVLFLAQAEGEERDVYLARVTYDHEGRPAYVSGLFNLSATAAAEETELVREGPWAAWLVNVAGVTRSVEVVDLRGETFPQGPGWGLVGRLQRKLTNIQQTGQARGVGHSSISLPEDAKLAIGVRQGVLEIDAGGDSARWELGRVASSEFADRGFVLTNHAPARPGNLTTWAVDRVRDIVGSDWMQWIKGVAFWANSQIEDIHADVVGVDAAESISEELGEVVERLPIAEQGSIPNWPPEPITPLLDPPLPAEGKWVDLSSDPIAGDRSGSDAGFVLTFIRVDPKRTYNQVSITLWDPRRIELQIVAGTEEPKSTLGQNGTGLIPRDWSSFHQSPLPLRWRRSRTARLVSGRGPGNQLPSHRP